MEADYGAGYLDGPSHVITIGGTKLDQGTDWTFAGGENPSQNSNQHNCNIQITITDKVKEALDKSPEVVITYKTVTDALPGWYSNFASVDGFSGYSDFVFYYVEGEAEPSVEKSVKINEDGSQARWDETFDWKSVDGSNDKVRGLSTGLSMPIELRRLPVSIMALAGSMARMSLSKMSFLRE